MDDPSTSGVTEGFGLMFYNARFYDPAIGRFTSADSIVPAGVQGYDRYAYVNNSPVNFVDPTGHLPCEYYGGDGCTSSSTGNGGGSDGENGGVEGNGDGTTCQDWTICINNVSPETIEDFWELNNSELNMLDWYDDVSGLGAWGGIALSILEYVYQRPVLMPEFIAILTGIAVVEPTPIVEGLIIVSIALAVTDKIVSMVSKDIQNINNGLVRSGALENGGTIIATYDSMNISTSDGAYPPVDTVVPFISIISVMYWADDNPLLTP